MEKLYKLAKKMESLGYETQVFENTDEVEKFLLNYLKDKIVGFGGSMGMKSMEIYEKLDGIAKERHWHWKTPEISREAMMKAHLADCYVCSANAVSENGEIINIDGVGNRVASTIFGPNEVIYVIGKNKIEKDFDNAMFRAKNEAAPKNTVRVDAKTPCRTDGKCHNCTVSGCICNVISVHRRKPSGIPKITIVLVNMDLGF